MILTYIYYNTLYDSAHLEIPGLLKSATSMYHTGSKSIWYSSCFLSQSSLKLLEKSSTIQCSYTYMHIFTPYLLPLVFLLDSFLFSECSHQSYSTDNNLFSTISFRTENMYMIHIDLNTAKHLTYSKILVYM